MRSSLCGASCALQCSMELRCFIERSASRREEGRSLFKREVWWLPVPLGDMRRSTCLVKKYRNFCALFLGLPMGVLTLCTVAAATLVIDRQYELRFLRKQTLSQRQVELEEQRRHFLDFIAQTDSEEELNNSVPLPGRFASWEK